MTMITRAQVKTFAPSAKAELVDAIIAGWPKAQQDGIDETPERLHAFMASIAVETGGLRAIVENLNYSAKRLTQVWPNRFPTLAAAKPYANNPEKLAIKTYGGRLGNKPAPSTDGWDYRGRGMMQTTGRSNYKKLGFESNPDDLGDPAIAFETAVEEWTHRGCNALADIGDRKAVRKAINGGLNGYTDFSNYWDKAADVWPVVDGSGDELDRPYGEPDEEADPPVPRPREERPTRCYTDKTTVERVQTQLRDLGYAEVGAPDGKIGKMTRTAILAFRNENDLPVTDVIDDDLLAALSTAKPREMDAERTEAPTKEVIKAVPEAKSNFLTRAWAWFLGGGALTVGGVSGAGDADPDPKGVFKTLLRYLQDVPGWMWAVGILVIAIAIWYFSRRTEKHVVEAYQAGARR